MTFLSAIDVHGHFGEYRRGGPPLVDEWLSGDAATVIARARQAHTRWTVVAPLAALLPRLQADSFAGNQHAARTVAETEGLLQWVVVNPCQPRTYEQAAEMLASPKCAGIKIHPEEHGYRIRDEGRAFFEFAAAHRALVLTHSGEPNSMPADFLPLANDYPEVTLILAHHGFSWDGDPTHQVRAIQASRHGNVLTDTSSAKSLMPGVIEWAAREIGADRLLYGSDTPLYFTPMQRARIDHADLGEEDKRRILYHNAAERLGPRIGVQL